MMNFSVLEVGVAVFFILAIIGFVTGGSHRRMRKAEETRRAQNEEEKRQLKAVMDKKREEKRQQLIMLREARRQNVIRENEEYKKRTGNIWQTEEAAMLEYDTHLRAEWEAVGMTPPSFVKNTGRK